MGRRCFTWTDTTTRSPACWRLLLSATRSETARRPPRLPAVLLNPTVGFPALWVASLALDQIHVLNVQRSWSAKAWIVMAVVPIAFVAGSLLSRAIVNARVAIRSREIGCVVTPRRVLVVLLLIGYAELAREFASAGTIPLFSSHIDVARTGLSSGALELLTAGLTVCVIVALATPPRLLAREALPELAIAALALFAFGLSGGRETVAIPLAGALIARSLYHDPPRLRSVLVLGLLAAGAFSLVFYLRTGQETGQAFAHELYANVVPSTPAPLLGLLPIHFALGLNFTVLARLIEFFPGSMHFGHGVYDAYALHAILPARSLGTVTQTLTPPWVVSTLAGPLWADGGFPVVIGGSIVMGGATSAAYWLHRRTHSYAHALLAAYFGALALFCVYTNLMTTYKDWVMVAIVLYAVGRSMERHAVADEPATAPPPAPRFPSYTGPAVSVLTVVALFAVVAIVAEHHAGPANQPSPAYLSDAGVPAIRVVTPTGLEPGMLTGALATDPDAGGPPDLWSFATRSGRVLATRFVYRGGRLRPRPAIDVGAAPRGRRVEFGVSQWGPANAEAVFEIVPHRSRLSVTVIGLQPRAHVIARMLTPPIPPTPGATRQIAVVTRSGTIPDLIALDRGPRGPMTLRVYSGASAFQQVVIDRQLPFGTFAPSAWNAVVGAAESSSADIVLMTRAPVTNTGHMEVHILPGASGYSGFAEQAPIDLPAGRAAAMRFMVTHVHGAPALYGIDPGRGQIVLLSLAPLPSNG